MLLWSYALHLPLPYFYNAFRRCHVIFKVCCSWREAAAKSSVEKKGYKCKRVARNNTGHHYGWKKVLSLQHYEKMCCYKCGLSGRQYWKEMLQSEWLNEAQYIPDIFYSTHPLRNNPYIINTIPTTFPLFIDFPMRFWKEERLSASAAVDFLSLLRIQIGVLLN